MNNDGADGAASSYGRMVLAIFSKAHIVAAILETNTSLRATCNTARRFSHAPICPRLGHPPPSCSAKVFSHPCSFLLTPIHQRRSDGYIWQSPLCGNSLYMEVALVTCCLHSAVLSGTFVHPTQPVEIFGNVFSLFRTLAIRWHQRKILRKSSQRNPSMGEGKRKRVANYSDFGAFGRP